jgi:ribonuclease HI
MANRYGLITNRKVDTPMTTEPLLPFEGQATESQINGYQAKVGSALYSATTTRPDVAKATAKTAEFLMNPGPRHIDAIDRVIQYLHQTRFLAIEYGRRSLNENEEKSITEGIDFAAKSIEFATDASFGDNPDRRSSEGYICKLYGGPIDWKASKQKTVTTSTTEAELLAISEAGKTVQWWRRVLRGLGFQPSHPLTIMCDNQQTVDLLTKEGAAMHTKLRHVDINRNWVKQEVSARRMQVSWVPTEKMPADGLTKPLPKQKHQTFLDLLGMRDIRHLIREEA